MADHAARRNIASRISTALSEYGLENSVSGGKFDDLRQDISPATGYWSENSYSSKPSRLIVHMRQEDGVWQASIPASNTNGTFAYANTARRDVGGIAVRVLPVFTLPDGSFFTHPEWEWLLCYFFWPELQHGSSGQVFDHLNPARGEFEYMGSVQDYIAAALVKLDQSTDDLHLPDRGIHLTYEEATLALQELFAVKPTPAGGEAARGESALSPVQVYDGLREPEIVRLIGEITASFAEHSENPDESEDEGGIGADREISIAPMTDLIGIDDEIYRQINAALASGYRHLLLYGPPGTGKTTIAQRVAGEFSDRWKLITGSADFTSQDVLGGYVPLEGGRLVFQPGVLLEHFDKPLIFDELNRCDIDKVIGPLFTVLSGQSTSLPYLVDPSDPTSARIEIHPRGANNPPQKYAPGSNWMLLATINSVDKASLYQMSYALTRRFAWIYIDVPQDLAGFVTAYLERNEVAPPADASTSPLVRIWSAINAVRPIGPAPIIDFIKTVSASNPGHDFYKAVETPQERAAYLDGFSLFMMPMLDGILNEQAQEIARKLIEILQLPEFDSARVTERMARLAL